MEKIVAELRKIITLKDTTAAGDIVLVVSLDPQMIVYALIESIEKDSVRKDDWWNLNMHFLTVPPQKTTWTLRTPQFTGQEMFTMDGAERFVQAVHFEWRPDSSTPDFKSVEDRSRGSEKKQSPFRRVK